MPDERLSWARRYRRVAFHIAQGPRVLGGLAMAERERWTLWLAPFLGLGIGLYFGLPQEPPLWVGLGAVTVLFALLLVAWRRGALWAVPMAALTVVAAGLAIAQGQAWRAAAPVLERPLGPVEVRGRVADLEPDGGRWRVTLEALQVERLVPEDTPSRLRITLYDPGDAVPGGRIEVLARLMPPPSPAAPGGFDFPRQAWFEQLGAVGYAVSVPRALSTPPSSPWRGVGAWITQLRLTAAERLREGVGGTPGAVAAALATGQRGAVPDDVIEAYRASGLAHLLAISGLHLGLAAGLVFVVLRAGLALIPPVVLRWNIKKLTAAFAIIAMAGYLALSGGNVPAQRAFIMGLVMFGAVLVDRSAVTLRVLAVAAVLVLLWQPQALVGASFQMSFAAVVALVAAYEGLAPRLAAWRSHVGDPWGATGRAVLVYMLGIFASTLIAGLATAPFAAFHFHRIALYGIAANVAAMPLMALWVMPWLALSLLLMPFGLDWIAYLPLQAGLAAVEAVAMTVAGWPDAVLAVPPMPVGALAVTVLGGLWLCLNRRGWRWLGLGLIIGGMAVPWLRDGPLVVVSGDGAVAAVRSGNGLVLSPGRGDTFTRDLWRELWGIGSGQWTAVGLGSVPDGAAAGTPARLTCDARGCLYAAGEGTPLIALVHHPAALAEDCSKVGAVVATVGVPYGQCRAALVISRWDLWRDGAHALYATDDGLRVETVAGHRGQRPWSMDTRRW